jgi:hypothetical protein
MPPLPTSAPAAISSRWNFIVWTMPPNSVRLKLKKHPVTFKQIWEEKILKRRRGKK